MWQNSVEFAFILNMKHLVTLKYKQRKPSNASSENNLEDCP